MRGFIEWDRWAPQVSRPRTKALTTKSLNWGRGAASQKISSARANYFPTGFHSKDSQTIHHNLTINFTMNNDVRKHVAKHNLMVHQTNIQALHQKKKYIHKQISMLSLKL